MALHHLAPAKVQVVTRAEAGDVDWPKTTVSVAAMGPARAVAAEAEAKIAVGLAERFRFIWNSLKNKERTSCESGINAGQSVTIKSDEINAPTPNSQEVVYTI